MAALRPIREAVPRVTAHAEPAHYLVYEEGGQLAVIRLDKEITTVGRRVGADVRFDDVAVSPRHALIARGSHEVRVLDNRSLGGVFVNGERVDRRALQDGDEIAVGRRRLVFRQFTRATPRRSALADRDASALAPTPKAA